MIEIAAAVSLATSAFGALKQAMEAGKDVEDMVGYFGKFFDAKEQLSEANMKASSPSIIGKLFNGSSVEAQALEITAARHKIMAIEKELREYLIYTGQLPFYEDMMRERREIRLARAKAAKKAAEKKALIIDIAAVVIGTIVTLSIVIGFVSIIAK
jgi:hypothetical protein